MWDATQKIVRSRAYRDVKVTWYAYGVNTVGVKDQSFESSSAGGNPEADGRS